MTTTTVYATEGAGNVSGDITSEHGTYATAVAGSGTKTLNKYPGLHYVGQWQSSPFEIYQTYLSFDTSSIPDSDTISSVTLNMAGDGGAGGGAWTVEVYAYDYGATLTTADWRTAAQIGGLTRVATVNHTVFTVLEARADFTSDAAFLTEVNKTGATRLVIVSSKNRTSTSPTGDEYHGLYPANDGDNTFAPRLTIVHAGASGPTTTRVNAVVSVPSVGVASKPEPTRVNAVASVPAPTPKASGTVTATRVNAVAAVGAAQAIPGTIVQPSRVNAVASVPAPTAIASANATATRVDAVAAVGTTVIAIAAMPTRVNAVASIALPSFTATAQLTPTRVDALAVVPSPSVLVSNIVSVGTVTACVIVPSTGVSLLVAPTRVDALAIIAGVTPVETESIVRLIGPTTGVSWAKHQPTFLKNRSAFMAGPTPTSMTVYKVDGVWKAGQMLTTAMVDAAEVVYLGGHEFDATYTEYLEMVADGVTPTIVEVLA